MATISAHPVSMRCSVRWPVQLPTIACSWGSYLPCSRRDTPHISGVAAYHRLTAKKLPAMQPSDWEWGGWKQMGGYI
eukprot:1142216-Pelagomonas_calceolata.AAC.9